ncbi:cupredoxin family protein [Bordetella genomosp. 12]|uniref:Blue (type 1) copper domain-containing protein n=1 Tax=Bordetella genomosp. 12 TaxID=463035 RepID=A0A261VUE0_9BORD|nr:cupredoxin family protein [Bordetella genomosp. 12]OZI77381.1 hypothetical protein CAL22_02205 [Bordetella genomosp. 12]
MKSFLALAVLAIAAAAPAGPATAAPDHAGMHPATADIGHPASQATRTVQIDMTDNMRFTPSRIDVRPGETVRFVVKNSGQIRHEFVLGTPADLQAHYQMMLQQPGAAHHAGGNAVSLAAGQTGELSWQFPAQGEVDFGCLEPGHYPAGMLGKVIVAAP